MEGKAGTVNEAYSNNMEFMDLLILFRLLSFSSSLFLSTMFLHMLFSSIRISSASMSLYAHCFLIPKSHFFTTALLTNSISCALNKFCVFSLKIFSMMQCVLEVSMLALQHLCSKPTRSFFILESSLIKSKKLFFASNILIVLQP